MDIIKKSADALRELTYKKQGLKIEQEIDERDYKAEDHLKLGSGKLPTSVDLFNTWPLDQKQTNHCTAYSATMAMMIREIKKQKNQSIFFNPVEQWTNQLEDPGTADEKMGDYIVSALKALKKFGLTYGKTYTIEKYTYVSRDQWKQVLAAGYPIQTGGSCNWPFTDGSHNWKPVKKGQGSWGHAWLVVGYDDAKQHYICVNSWGSKWGDRGRFYVKYSDAPLLFRGWTIE